MQCLLMQQCNNGMHYYFLSVSLILYDLFLGIGVIVTLIVANRPDSVRTLTIIMASVLSPA